MSEQADVVKPRGARRPLEAMDPRLTCIQPGGGVCMRLELAWGRVRRSLLRLCFPRYVARMAALRRGSAAQTPYPIVDPRDLKFIVNQPGPSWDRADDPFRWRDSLPLARAGLFEVLLLGGGSFALAALVAVWHWALAVPLCMLGLLILWFFRSPRRIPPGGEGLVLSPADGRIVQIQELDHNEFLGGPALQIGIFLSVFNVHINRAPFASRVIGLTYRPGRFLNALWAASARENEQIEVRFEQATLPYRGAIVRQIAGAIARRIVCEIQPGDELAAGAQFGMIKFGSRTELVIPREPGLVLRCQLGQAVRAGTTIVAEYSAQPSDEIPAQRVGEP